METAPDWVRALPLINAGLNGTCAVLLLSGYRLVRRRQIVAHRACMLGAFVSSLFFLTGYLTLHYHIGTTRFGHEGTSVRTLFMTILLTHTVLAVATAPMVLWTLARALRGRFTQHAALARWTLPIWLYVSVTGIVIYVMLYHVPGAAG
ncbi:MAG TPA: DUF420 domain-containing protein [Acidobacteriota bacterium]|nr:DUF420 domain-containing protein [Acidobacteriota bacterium]